MKSLSLAIVDDDSEFLDAMRLQVSGYCAERGLEHSVAAFPDAESFLDAFTARSFHIVLLDIMLPRENGITLAKRVHHASADTVIVFLTSSPDFAMEGYGVNAIRYVLKPVTADVVHELMDTCLERLNRSEKRILLKTGRATRHVALSSILYLESNDKQVHVYRDGETLCCQAKLSDLLERFPDAFVQVHKSYAVNLARAGGFKSDVILMDNGKGVPVSRRFRESATSAYFAFVATGL